MQRRNVRILLGIIVFLLALRLWHVRADFPNYHFYSQEGAQFTDEGFYTSAALSHYTLGHSYIPGGWNPGVFMPIWPFMLGLLFHFTGISVVAARSLSIVCGWGSVLLAYAIARQYRSEKFALLSAFLVAVNALGFFYSRLAILESAFVLFLLLAIYLAGRLKAGDYGLAAFVGIVFTIMTLTKTTGPFVFPAVLYPIWANNRQDRSAAWKLLAIAGGTALLLLGCAKLYWARHYLADSQMILGMNPLWQIENSPRRLLRFFGRGTWVDPVLFPLALTAFIAALVRLHFLWRDALFTTAFLWEMGYAAFIVFHYDGPPRYFVPLIVPTIWLALLFAEWLWSRQKQTALAVTACVAVSAVWNLGFIATYLAHPHYSLVLASQGMRRIITTQSGSRANELMIGRGADEFSLLSGGFPTMDSDGAMPLADKLDVYRPGWFMSWSNDVPLRMATIAAKRELLPRATFTTSYPEKGAGASDGVDTGRHATVTLYQLFPLARNATR